ncbi:MULTISPECIES: LysR family transcriptional regulator [unclassified Pseudomonas]|uniref:LysR family transcriptional regulator n=1 Tax=unclassified Pseudomonas TaxID=196821 RepID=UPI000BCC02E3|nr:MULTISPECIES: LysR family transcriptional regulator [unclassified Pseudomonas]PVZ08659.1 LysR family glycine cleavage system transcriptional activator [Pseudomonas sp. URIL14HWK12:I12]PVZ21086.1 LysR family glycine cleavage system transcriptional activator [Pseudomonas sp. URIL14HWK12:I10]PVZ29669.1 LysR family glycine cleavage system transcriptional activator [Pseudomonas sp. URIL14HWK12:I11]SNZ18912.1 LysR family transcriptional regulator, glycine cleavage system transcriptional activator 
MSRSLIPSLNWLRVFEAAARHQSFSKAGHELHMTGAAVSQQVQSLEASLGRPLFERSANRISLTPEGKDFLPTVQLSISAMESKAAALFSPQRVQRVSLQASHLMSMSWLPQVLADFERDNPSIRVELWMEGAHERKAEPDLTIRFGEEPDLVRHPSRLMGLSYVVMCRPADLARLNTVEDLLAHRLLEMIPHSMGWMGLLNQNFGSMRSHTLKLEPVDTTPLAFMMVSQGLGLAIGPVPVCLPLASSLGLVICPLVSLTPGPGNYYLEHPTNRPQSAAVLRLEHALHAAAQNSVKALNIAPRTHD